MVGEGLRNHEPWIEHLRVLMKRMGREVTERNAAQALVPESATVLHNEYGTAPALLMNILDTKVVAMPGVPIEMRFVMRKHVLPMIDAEMAGTAQTSIKYLTLHTTGIAESTLADVLDDPSTFIGDSTLAFLPNLRGVRLRIGAVGDTKEDRDRELERIKDYILSRAGKYVFGEGSDTLPEVIGRLLRERGENFSVAESCTGGMLGAACTDIPGSSDWFEGGVISYSNTAKTRELGVPADLVDRVGAVSEEVATAMSEGVRKKFNTTWGVGITGVAGPGGGTEEKPVGLVWISLAGPNGTTTTRFVFGKDRSMNRDRSVGAALAMLWSSIR